MNGTQLKNIEEIYWHFSPKKAIFHGSLVLLGIAFLFFITLMKAKGTAEFGFEPLLFAYTVFVTAFQLSRLVAAMFYTYSYRGSVLVKSPRNKSKEAYEPSVTFIIPCKNEEAVIAETVSNCFKVDYPKDRIEIIVINDGSTDGTAAAIEAAKRDYQNLIFVNWRENRGKKYAMAEGFRLAKGEIAVQLDSDSFIDPASFKKIIEPFQNLQVGAVSAHTDPKNADKNFLTKMQAAYYFMSFRILKAAESTFLTVFCCSGCASAYRKALLCPRWMNGWTKTFWGFR